MFFDMDGTLIDSMEYWNGIKREMTLSYYRRTGIMPEISDEDDEKLEGMTIRSAVKFINEKYGCKISTELDVRRPLAYFYADECKPKPFVLDALSYFKEHGVKMAIITATPRSLAEIALEKQGMLEFFDFILTPEDSEGGKRRRRIYYKACLKARCLPRNAVLIDDAAYALRTAARARLRCVAVYDEFRKDKAQNACDISFNDFGELLDYFKKHGKF